MKRPPVSIVGDRRVSIAGDHSISSDGDRVSIVANPTASSLERIVDDDKVKSVAPPSAYGSAFGLLLCSPSPTLLSEV
ncbi:hypothetical protein ACOSQ4_031257 [Xanthoceras sorbifolium]